MSTVLITGGNRGIGFGIAQAVASRIPSSTIILGCRRIETGHEAVERLRELGVSSSLDAVQIDIEDIQSITAAAEALDKRYGKLDVLINNAASLQLPKTQHLAELRDCSNRNFNSCVTSNMLVTKAFVPLLRKSSWPRVIMNSSARGSLGRTANKELPPVALVDYCMCKAALNMLTLHYQIIEDNYKDGGESITFWSVSPGHTKTAFNNFRGKKDPVASAEAFVRLLESGKGAIRPGTFWEFEDGKFQRVPWEIDVEAGQLPPPATKLVITQILQASQDPPHWAWIIVGAFYDSEDRIIWSTELFAAHLDIQFESDEDQVSEAAAGTRTAPEPESETEAEGETEAEDESEPDSPPGKSIADSDIESPSSRLFPRS
ncbi:hypothetical protein J3F83DRAFT_712985 [Trichoderma novae-zelandiae]